MITLDDALTCNTFYHLTERNKNGSPKQCRRNGKTKTWKTRPQDFRIPIKVGFRRYGYLTQDNCRHWLPYDPIDIDNFRQYLGFVKETPWQIVYDKLLDLGREKEAEYWKRHNVEVKSFTSWNDVFTRCNSGDKRAQQIVIGTLENLGCEHLAQFQPTKEKWQKAYRGLQEYIGALIAEYGQGEFEAEQEVLAELNNLIDCCYDVEV